MEFSAEIKQMSKHNIFSIIYDFYLLFKILIKIHFQLFYSRNSILFQKIIEK